MDPDTCALKRLCVRLQDATFDFPAHEIPRPGLVDLSTLKVSASVGVEMGNDGNNTVRRDLFTFISFETTAIDDSESDAEVSIVLHELNDVLDETAEIVVYHNPTHARQDARMSKTTIDINASKSRSCPHPGGRYRRTR